MFECLLQKSFQENLYSWQDKFDTGTNEFWQYWANKGKPRFLAWISPMDGGIDHVLKIGYNIVYVTEAIFHRTLKILS